jgi:RHS repeat-associated protein
MTPPPPPPGDPPDDSGDGDGCGCGGGGGDDGGGDMGGDDGGDDGGGDMGDDGGSDMGGDDGDEGDDGGDVEVIPITLGKPGGAGGVLNLSYKAPIGGNTVVKGAHAPVISPDAQASKAATKSLLGQTFDGPSGGDPVNMATGEEEYQPKPDLVVYNPNGPEVVWSRIYNSLRGPNFSYQYSDYGINWSQPYNVGVYDPSPGQVGGNNPKYVTFANGARLSLTISALPSAGVPTVAAVVQPGSPFVVNCRYTSASPYGYYQIEFRDRTVWTTMPIATGTDSYVLAKITDRNGHSLVFNYVAGASVPASVFQAPIPVISTIVDGVSGKTLLTINRAHDGTDNVTFVEDNQGRTVLYHCGTYANVNVPPAYGVFYQQVDNVSIVQNGPAPLPTDRYQYGYTQIANGEGNEEVPFLTSITVPSPTGVGTVSNSIEYGLESDGVIARTDANGNTHSYLSTDQYGNSSFPSSYTRVLITDSSNHVIGGEIVGYDNNEDETSVSDINGNPVRSISYSDPNDPFKPSAVQDGVGLTTHFTWDAYGNMTSRKSPKGTVTTRTFTYAPFPLGELTKVQVGTKSATKYTYAEPSGDVTSVTMPAPGTSASTSTVTTSYSYDAFGNLTSVVTPGDGDVTSKTTTLNYTADGSYSQQEAINEPILIKDNAGDESHYRYNLFGKASAYEDALNRAYSATFDIGGNQIALIFPQTGENGTGHAMQQWSFLYPDGPLQSVEWHDEAGNLTRTFMYTYGNEGELSGFTDGFQPEFFTYDGGYRVVKIEDGKPNATTFSYDVRNDLVQAVTAAGEKTTYSYDADFRPTKRVDARSIETDYSYVDGDGNLSDVKYPSAAALNVHIGYDAYDRSTGTSDGTGTNAYTYDDDNDLLTAVTTYAGVPAQTLTYAYFPDGSRSSVATPAGMYSYTYDAIGRMVSVKNPAGEKSTFSFYANSFPDEVILANGAKSLYVPDARDAVSKITNLVGSTTLSAFGGSAGIVRDSLGEPLSMIATATSAALAGTTSYTLDGMGQLLEEKSTRNGTYDNKFGYDVANNPDLVRGTSATFNGDDENTALVYDLAGNGEAFPGTTSKATYDVEDRMTAFGTALTAGYRYDNLRAWTQSGSTKTYFLYDGWSPIAEISSTGSVSAYNTFGAFGLMSRRQAGTSIFYQFDPFGNVAHRTGSSGAILSNSVYDSYGKGESSATLTDPFGFGGQYGYYTDRATALVLMTHRYYDPDQARFVTRDPMGTSGGINPYGYAKNNPTVSVDPQGFDSSCPVFKYNDPINNWNAGWQTGWNAAGGDSNWITGAVGGTVGAWTGLTQTPYSFTPPTPPVNTGP